MLSRCRMPRRLPLRYITLFVLWPFCISSAAEGDGLVGRSDPFAEISRPSVVVEQSLAVSEPALPGSSGGRGGGRGRLFAETVAVRNLDAYSLKEAISSMNSDYGRISVDKQSNSLIICDTAEDLEAILAEIGKIDRSGEGLSTETVTLRYLKPSNLKSALENMASQFGRITVDEDTNSLIVCDTAERLSSIVSQIHLADRRPEQVMIEVVIADVQISDDTEIGVNWESIFDNKWDGSYTQDLVSTLSAAGTIGGDLSIINANISGVLHALQEVRNVEILASPRVMVLSGQEAQIRTVEEIPYEEVSDTSDGGSGAITSIEFKSVGITLKVKATVTDENTILLRVEPEQSVATGEAGVQDVPIVDSRSASTTLLIRDGQVVVLGGLRRTEKRMSSDKIPGLGDLPLVGVLFSRNQQIVENSELMVFISPHIYRDEPLTAEQAERFNQLRDKPMLGFPDERPQPKIVFEQEKAPW